MINKVAIGTAQFGYDYGIANKEGKIKSSEIINILKYVKKNKIKYLDTSNAYGKSEKEIGNFYYKTGFKFKVITKYSKCFGTVDNQFKKTIENLGYKPSIILAHQSKDYLNKNFNNELFNIKKKNPEIKIGASVYNIKEFKRILSFRKPDVINVPLNILDQEFDNKNFIETIKKKKIKVQVRSIFLQGIFFLKLNLLQKKLPLLKNAVGKIYDLKKKNKKSINDLLINWIKSKYWIDKIIIGCDNIGQLRQNLRCFNKVINIKLNQELDNIKFNLKKNLNKANKWKIKK
jgi:hypothetical protein